MVFASMLFVFLFLVANLASQIALRNPRGKNIAMLVFSLVFYAWSGPRYLLLLMGMVLICWLGALLVESTGRPKLWLGVTVGLCLGILGVFKYTGFFLQNLQNVFGVPEVIPAIALPIGISFYTFQLISYVVDVYRGEVQAQQKYWVLLLYASLFHQCIAGPIVRYQDIHRDILQRRTTPAEISRGISRFTVGLAKKAILANGCAVVADGFFDVGVEELAALPAAGILLGAFAFTLQIYLDFSAYSDMAIGMGLMCGFHYKENFNYPYLSTSAGEFWRRWNISLGAFFRDYVYIPLGGNRRGKLREFGNLLIVWFLTGLWHGASWNFVLWGLYWGALICIERFLLGRRTEAVPKLLRQLFVFALAVFGWILFKFTDFTLLTTALKGLLGLNGNGWMGVEVKLAFQNNVFFLLLAAIGATAVGKNLRQILQNLARWGGKFFFWCNGAWEVLHPVLLLLISAMALAGDSYNPFLYFQF